MPHLLRSAYVPNLGHGKIWRVSLAVIFAIALSSCNPIAPSLQPPDNRCPIGPSYELHPGVGKVVGEYPIWLVVVTDVARIDLYPSQAKGVKLLWVVSRDQLGDLVITGGMLNSRETLQFRLREHDVATDALVFPNAHGGGVGVGGATRDNLAQYAHYPSMIVFPSPGCWELTARLGVKEVRIPVLAVRSETD